MKYNFLDEHFDFIAKLCGQGKSYTRIADLLCAEASIIVSESYIRNYCVDRGIKKVRAPNNFVKKWIRESV